MRCNNCWDNCEPQNEAEGFVGSLADLLLWRCLELLSLSDLSLHRGLPVRVVTYRMHIKSKMEAGQSVVTHFEIMLPCQSSSKLGGSPHHLQQYNLLQKITRQGMPNCCRDPSEVTRLPQPGCKGDTSCCAACPGLYPFPRCGALCPDPGPCCCGG